MMPSRDVCCIGNGAWGEKPEVKSERAAASTSTRNYALGTAVRRGDTVKRRDGDVMRY